MPESKSVWGIEIGQAGLKALKLRYAEAAHQVVAVGFDYIPHAKILSQPDAIPDELIAEAITKFLSRNKVQDDIVAIGLPAQSSLARFIQLPPVEAGKVKEIVKYEAKQQIPFPLEDVIWDYQQMGGGEEAGGFVIDSEVGIFATKRDQVMHQLHPFQSNKVEIELMQIAPVALYSFLAYDRLSIRPDGEGAPVDEEHTAVLDMGSDQSTIMVTDGAKIWIRNIPIGGNHFTRALTKEMKLTFAKAEHLKCNATKSPDPKAVFQALKPVFNDYLSEVQRSLGYFSSVSQGAEIKKVIGCGNGFRMAGLQKFLEQNLELPVERAEEFKQLAGTSVLEAQLFKENIMSFTVAYGLAIQAMGLSRMGTNLLPPEIARAREIRRKKPWAAITAATLLTGLALSTIGTANAWRVVHSEPWDKALKTSGDLQSKWGGYQSSYSTATGRYDSAKSVGKTLVEGMKDTIWLEFYKSVNECMPRDIGQALDEDNIEYRNRVLIKSITAEKSDDLAAWFEGINTNYKALSDEVAEDRGLKPQPAPEGEGYIFTLNGEHYHHIPDKPETDQGINYLLDRVIPNLQTWTFKQEDGDRVDVRKMGITNPVVLYAKQEVVDLAQRASNARKDPRFNVVNPTNRPQGDFNEPMPDAFSADPSMEEFGYDNGQPQPGRRNMEFREVHRTQFQIQFVWKPIPEEERLEEDPLKVATEESENSETTTETEATVE
ncbi:MAG: pilus assembly protein PilM [Rubinisphaera sp.]|uniref:type IV pilus assembly protein PilM n=1 Tax=Rubinisphaera sp. TaxID=2024857 RepID=UPI000C10A844|nr:type IV pilus assembly protein PilM [Rubinisphaera sp.]MBV08791.1 pilus assembly protein PilM [Rubinisphaera sp.]